MKNQYFNKFFSSIIAPAILAMILFIVSFFMIIIPQFEKNMMERKKEMIMELTNAAISIIIEHNQTHKSGSTTLSQAMENAAKQIEQMRYGNKGKDYFWIIDNTPMMIMHPYRTELNGKNLADFKDSHEKMLFAEAARIVKDHNEGFINYYWQWKDDTSMIVPKLSYVKGYPEWQWIVGTGIYLNDVKAEIHQLKTRLRSISGIIFIIILFSLFYIIKQSYKIEHKRKLAEEKLVQSNIKYKTLVEASTEGTLMFIDQKVTFSNLKFAEMIGMKIDEILGKIFDEIFTIKWENLLAMFNEPLKTITVETSLKCSNNTIYEAVISVSRIKNITDDAFIVVAKDVSRPKLMERSAKKLSEELNHSLQLMNQPLKPFIKRLVTCNCNGKIFEAAELMKKNNSKTIFVTESGKIIGVVTDADLKNKVLATRMSTESNISTIMSEPVICINEDALLYEAIILFQRHQISHLLVTNFNNTPLGVISNQDALELQLNSLTYMIKEINTAKNIQELKNIQQGTPVLIQSILTGSDNTHQTFRTLTKLTDSITNRVIELAIDEMGLPPCDYAFIVLGSEGRMEQTLKTDQDNAFVLCDNATESDINYFLTLAKKINHNLDDIGYNLCKGEVMAKNIRWCQPISVWKDYFVQWTNSPEPQNVLESSIFYDFRYIAGNPNLVNQLKSHVIKIVENNGLFFYHMAGSITQLQIDTSTDEINLKKVLLPFISYIRFESLKQQLTQTGTIERIEALAKSGYFNEEREKESIELFNFFMYIRLKHQLLAIQKNDLPENTIQLDSLSNVEHITIKKMIKEIEQIQKQLALYN